MNKHGAAVACMVLLACSPTAERHPRERLFPALPAGVIEQAFPADAALHVLYWPGGGCQACNAPALRALAELVVAHPEIAAVIVVPEGFPSPAAATGVAWPGAEVTLEPDAFRAQAVFVPLPRVEVWDPQGQLLLLRAIPPNAVQAAAIGAEVLWAKALAKPTKAMQGGGP
jgi:hypothetical protein